MAENDNDDKSTDNVQPGGGCYVYVTSQVTLEEISEAIEMSEDFAQLLNEFCKYDDIDDDWYREVAEKLDDNARTFVRRLARLSRLAQLMG
jgi:hypothetical protein